MKRSLFLFCTRKTPPFISFDTLPSCRNCVHFISDYSISSSKCKQFAEKDIITGELTYKSASKCRDDEKKCSIHGQYFQPLVYHEKLARETLIFLQKYHLPIYVSMPFAIFFVIDYMIKAQVV